MCGFGVLVAAKRAKSVRVHLYISSWPGPPCVWRANVSCDYWGRTLLFLAFSFLSFVPGLLKEA